MHALSSHSQGAASRSNIVNPDQTWSNQVKQGQTKSNKVKPQPLPAARSPCQTCGLPVQASGKSWQPCLPRLLHIQDAASWSNLVKQSQTKSNPNPHLLLKAHVKHATFSTASFSTMQELADMHAPSKKSQDAANWSNLVK
jgi:hypothetical protein